MCGLIASVHGRKGWVVEGGCAPRIKDNNVVSLVLVGWERDQFLREHESVALFFARGFDFTKFVFYVIC